jgi:hypothetical protein
MLLAGTQYCRLYSTCTRLEDGEYDPGYVSFYDTCTGYFQRG